MRESVEMPTVPIFFFDSLSMALYNTEVMLRLSVAMALVRRTINAVTGSVLMSKRFIMSGISTATCVSVLKTVN